MILVKFGANYADEFDTNGFKLMTQYEFDAFLAGAREDFIREAADKPTPYQYHCGDGEAELIWNDKEVEKGFGTNEGWMWHSYEDFVSSIECQQIGDLTYEIMKRLFPEAENYGYGMFPNMGEW